MSLQLDERQKAMLAQMGVRVFEPARAQSPPVALSPLMPPAQSARAAAPVVREAAPAPVPVVLPRPGAPDLGALDWEALARVVAGGEACPLCAGQARTVFGAGDRQAPWLIVGDPPDEQEERSGVPFAGDAGVLLDNMLASLGLDRQSKVYLTNITKCRPPANRNPTREDIAQCEPVLRRQVQLLRPRVIVLMGRFAVPSLLATTEPLGKLRGRAYAYEGVPVVVTYHPAYLLRNPAEKARAWADLCLAQALLRAQPPA